MVIAVERDLSVKRAPVPSASAPSAAFDREAVNWTASDLISQEIIKSDRKQLLLNSMSLKRLKLAGRVDEPRPLPGLFIQEECSII